MRSAQLPHRVAIEAAQAGIATWAVIVFGLAVIGVALAVACGYATAKINGPKGRSRRAGFWWGLFFTVFAVAVAAVLPKRADAAAATDRFWPLSRRVRISLAAVPFVVVAGVFGAILIYTKIINDPAPALGTEDLNNVFATSPSTGATTSDPPSATNTTPTAADVTTTAPSTSTASGLDGVWDVDATNADTTFGYRVQEVLGGVDTTATGRGNDIAGSITVEGTSVTEGSITVQVATITSDKNNRDNQFRGRIMETDRFPTALFTLTSPIELGSVPAVGEQITASATGDLTLHGVTNPVTFDVTAQTDGNTIGVLGSIPVVFADYDIANPSNGVVTTEDNGLLEFVIVFKP